MGKLILLLLPVAISCHHKPSNPLIGKWQLIKKLNDQQVIFGYNPAVDPNKYIYWFKNDSTLITEDDDGGNMNYNSYQFGNDKITLYDSLHSNTFYVKLAGDRLTMKSVYSPFNLELKKIE